MNHRRLGRDVCFYTGNKSKPCTKRRCPEIAGLAWVTCGYWAILCRDLPGVGRARLPWNQRARGVAGSLPSLPTKDRQIPALQARVSGIPCFDIIFFDRIKE